MLPSVILDIEDIGNFFKVMYHWAYNDRKGNGSPWRKVAGISAKKSVRTA
jgi:hypothetical protein